MLKLNVLFHLVALLLKIGLLTDFFLAGFSLLCQSVFGYIFLSVSSVPETKSVVLGLVKSLLLEPVLGW